jgi:hypothetical protein
LFLKNLKDKSGRHRKKTDKEVKRKMEKQKINAIEAVALIVGTILALSISVESSNVSSDNWYERNMDWGEIEAYAELIYGSPDLPLLCPLSNVKITAKNVFDTAFNYTGLTNYNGKCKLSSIHTGFYKITAEKDGFVDMTLIKNYRIIKVISSQRVYVKFTLAEEGSPWDVTVMNGSINKFLLKPLEILVERLNMK